MHFKRSAVFKTVRHRSSAGASSFDAETLTITAVIASQPAPVKRSDTRGPYEERLDFTGVDFGALAGLPLLNAHRSGKAEDSIGEVLSAHLEGDLVVAQIRLSGADDVAPVRQRAADKILHFSIGYTAANIVKTVRAGMRVRTITPSIHEVSTVPLPADRKAKQRSGTMDPEDNDVVELTAEEVTQIRNWADYAGLAREQVEDVLDAAEDIESARELIRAAQQERNATARRITSVRAQPHDDPDAVLALRTEALACRALGGTPSDAARAFMHDRLSDHAAGLLRARGETVRAGESPEAILTRAAQHTISNFPALLAGVGNRALTAGFTPALSPLRNLARQGTRPDFRPSTQLRTGELGMLQKVSESGEIKSDTRVEESEGFAIDTYASMFSLSRKAILNDDLGAFASWGRDAGQAAAATENALVVAMLTKASGSGPVMGDGKTLFHADHGNIASGTLPTTPEELIGLLSAARLAMRKQVGVDGKTIISVSPKTLVVPAELETIAEAALTLIAAARADDVNVFGGKLSLAVEPRITGRFYLVGDYSPIEVAYLASAPGPQMASREGWDVLGQEFRVVLDFGCGVTDWRNIYQESLA
ncbi:hypothetical protein BA190_03865 [Labrys sp. WJW]|uniref:phage major capsid protein n=1 Tax=Labrys sp. WJW TaxID=1737983 RepID=UPI0008309ACC|nr:Mu-like prophage major head subunit gpT family protein [Labrys sp. WJW]OCC06375.1 hypothetical protein BA190_03865 [Labrys sp. WJW]